MTQTPPFDAPTFRRQLHQHPELSGQEQHTARAICEQLQGFGLEPITDIGGHGIICIIEGQHAGDTTLLRADFDALPITEVASHDHISQKPGIMHACGHDGHTTSLLKVAEQLSLTPPQCGKVILLFQPAEEIGTGAAAMLSDSKLRDITIDHAFAYHNLPGHPLHQVIVKPSTFACASVGAKIELQGKTSHAAWPEHGINPTSVMLEIIEFLQALPNQYRDVFSLVTVAHVKLGDAVFGVAPGSATILATMRSECNQTFATMQQALIDKLAHLKLHSELDVHLSWDEPFQAAVNDEAHYQMVKQQAQALGLNVTELAEPMRWSEDFAEFLAQTKGALFCIGSGEHHPELHNPDYDFPDPLLDTAAALFLALINDLHQNESLERANS